MPGWPQVATRPNSKFWSEKTAPFINSNTPPLLIFDFVSKIWGVLMQNLYCRNEFSAFSSTQRKNFEFGKLSRWFSHNWVFTDTPLPQGALCVWLLRLRDCT